MGDRIREREDEYVQQILDELGVMGRDARRMVLVLAVTEPANVHFRERLVRGLARAKVAAAEIAGVSSEVTE